MTYRKGSVPVDGTGTATSAYLAPLLNPTTGSPVYLTIAQFLALGGGSVGSAPVNSALPAITGTAQVGQTLMASQGTWSNSPTSYTYQWKGAGTAISGATSSSYAPVTGDIGNVLTVTVTATNSTGSASATSSATSAVIAAGSGTAPGQVGSLAAGTPTSTTIPVTYTAASGTAPITYTGQTRVHGSGSGYTSNGGTFTSTGGTFTGLTASTSYDLQITASNAAGSSTTVLVAGVGTGAGASYPSVVWSTQPTFETANPIDGNASLKGGVGRVTFTLPANANGNNLTSYRLGYKIRAASAGGINGYGQFLTLTTNAGGTANVNNYGFGFQGGQDAAITHDGNNTYITNTAHDGAVHYLELSVVGNYGQYAYTEFRFDGNLSTVNNVASGSGETPVAGTAWLDIDMTKLASGDVLDSIWISSDTSTHPVPTGTPTRDANTLVLLTFDDQTGNGS